MDKFSYDIIIVGGGIIGSAIAYNLLKTDDRLNVCVVERDPTYERASTTLSMANVRIQFDLKANIEISRYAFEVLENFETEMRVKDQSPKIYFHREGNLFLVDENGYEPSTQAMALQQSLGCPVEWWSAEKIKATYPLYDSSSYKGGTFGSKDGHFDAYAVLMGYKAKGKSMGATYLADEVKAVTTANKSVDGVRLASGKDIKSKIVINCAGAWAHEVAATAGVTLPVEPVSRQIFVLDTAVKPEGPLPLTILPSGLYFRTETGGTILLGKSIPEDPVGYHFNCDHNRFMEVLWLELAEFVPVFERLKLVRGWAGLYAVNTLDQNAILGQWPELKGFYLANGFSGHGLQQAPAVGRYLAELITQKELSLDLELFSPQRIFDKKPIGSDGWEIV